MRYVRLNDDGVMEFGLTKSEVRKTQQDEEFNESHLAHG